MRVPFSGAAMTEEQADAEAKRRNLELGDTEAQGAGGNAVRYWVAVENGPGDWDVEQRTERRDESSKTGGIGDAVLDALSWLRWP